jgi:hypothetical protein
MENLGSFMRCHGARRIAANYLRRERWSGWAMIEDMFEVSMRWPGRSCGTAGGAHSPLNPSGSATQ